MMVVMVEGQEEGKLVFCKEKKRKQRSRRERSEGTDEKNGEECLNWLIL